MQDHSRQSLNNLSIVIACYNSELSIRQVVDEIIDSQHHPEMSHLEIILVNDGSKDRTESIIAELTQAHTFIKGISFSKNFGQQAAMLAGFRAAKGDMIAYCDDDGQSPVDELYKLIQKLKFKIKFRGGKLLEFIGFPACLSSLHTHL